MRISIILLFLFISTTFFGQTLSVAEVLKQADQQLQKLSTISYTIEYGQKSLTKEDTIKTKVNCSLKAVPGDTLKIHHHFINNSNRFQQLYNGDQIVNINHKDSSATLVDPQLYGYGSIQDKFILYSLFNDHFFEKRLEDTSLISSQVSEVNYRGVNTYVVHFKYLDDQKNKVTNIRSNYFFRKSDGFPIGYEFFIDFQNMHQYITHSLFNIEINPTFDPNFFDLNYHINDYFKLMNYAPSEAPTPLSEGVLAPDFTLPSTDGKEFKLSDHRGKIVILDFWYRSCYPCIKALPQLQQFSTEHSPDEILLVGMNPFDSKEKIIDFLDKRGVTYTSVYNAKEIAKEYKVTGYPHLFVINPEGKIHVSHSGWDEAFYNELFEEIKAFAKAQK